MTQEDFKREVLRLRPGLIQTARRYLDGDEAEDAVQDVLLRLWQMLGELQLPIDRLAAVLVRNLCIDKVRRRRPTVSMEAVPDIAPEDTAHRELMEHTMRIVEQLPSMQQTIIRLRHMEGMEMKDIAQLTGSTETAVRKALSRARKAVRDRYLNEQKTS